MRKEGLAHWEKISGYHRRSLAETAMSRFKQLMAENQSAQLQRSGRRNDGVCESDKQTEYPWFAVRKPRV